MMRPTPDALITNLKTPKGLPEVEDVATAIKNIAAYNDAVAKADTFQAIVRKDLLRTISMARAWFSFQHGDVWYVAPAKFAGFVGMTPEYYSANRVKSISGTRGEIALKRLSASPKPVETNHSAFKALETLATQIGRKLSELAEVHVLRAEPVIIAAKLPLLELRMIDMVIACGAALSPDGLAMLKQRVAAM